jgi:uncharacterized membrane protein YjfL (UPF0719 family)
MEVLVSFLHAFIYSSIVIIFMFIAKKFADIKVGFLYDANQQIQTFSNIALAFRRSGLYLGVAIAMFVSIGDIKDTSNLANNIIAQIIDGSLILIFLFLAMVINDKILLKNINNNQAILQNNIAVSLVEFGSFIATSIIAYASFYGDGPWYSSIIFFILGQVLLILMVVIYESFMKFDILESIKDDNISSGLLICGVLISYSIVLKSTIMGPFISWSNDLFHFAISALSGIILLLILSNSLINRLFLVKTSIKKEIIENKNIPSILIVVSLKIAIALVISSVVL